MAGEGWFLERYTDEFTDEVIGFANLAADNTKSMKQAPTEIVVGYTEDKGLEVCIMTNFFVEASSDGMAQVRYRFDDDKEIGDRWQIESGDTGSILFPHAPEEFIAVLQSKKELLFEITDDTGKSYRNRFRGLDKNTNDLKQVVDGCKLKGVKTVSEGWSLERYTDGFTDEVSFAACVMAEDLQSKRENLTGIWVGYIKDTGFGAAIFTNFVIPRDNKALFSVRVRYRFDDDKPIAEYWPVGKNIDEDIVYTTVPPAPIFFPALRSKPESKFITGLQSKKELLFEITDGTGKSYRNHFRRLDKNADNLKQVIDACQP